VNTVMKKMLLMTVGFAALGMAPAVAADLAPRMYTKAPPAAVAPIYNWTGFYIGAMGGYAKEDSGDFGVKGGFGGGTIGYNWQTDKFVFGTEADAAAADISSGIVIPGSLVGIPGSITGDAKIRDLGTARGRFGVVFDQVLLYGTAGFAWADTRVSATAVGVTASDSQVHSGWTAGAGVEVMFAPHWSVKAEYLYRDLDSKTYFSDIVPGGLDSGSIKLHSAQVGVNYHF